MSASALGIDFAQKGLSFYTIPAVWILAMVPHFYAGVSAGKNMDNAYPRDMTEKLKNDQSMDKRTKGRILRAMAAENNTMETLGFMAGGVIAANVAGVDAELTNTVSFSLLGLRALYIFVYVWLQDGRDYLSPVRSLLWTAKQCGIIYLYVLAANAYSKL